MGILNEFFRSFSPSQNGFVFMWILSGIAVASLFVIIERWIGLARRTNIDSFRFVERLGQLIKEGKLPEAYGLCMSGKNRILPQILGAGIQRASVSSEMVPLAMEEESLRQIPILERRIDFIAACGNLATLLGLMGTIYGLILAFSAVARPEVSPLEKSSMLATGISAAMNTTLLGLMIAVPCVLAYSAIRNRIDETVSEIDRYAVSVIKLLVSQKEIGKSYRISDRRIRQEIETEPNIVPFMNLMVVLIPLLLSSSEFVKLGMIELKLPESSAAGGGDEENVPKNAKLDLGVAITKKGFNLFHYFRKDTLKPSEVDIPLIDGEFNYAELNRRLAEVKRMVLYEMIRAVKPDLHPQTDLWKLWRLYTQNDFCSAGIFDDHENVKIVAEDRINYQTVVSVMDAARSAVTPAGTVTLFPNVSIAGGIVQ